MRLHYNSRKYVTLVEWIACNDGPGDNETLVQVADHMTVTMLAHCYKLTTLQVAEDVMVFRSKYLETLANQ